MAIVTNNYGVPSEYVELADDDDYIGSGNDFSVTTLIDAPQVRWLRERHPWSNETDVSDRIAAMIGSGIHQVFEAASLKLDNVKVEQKFVVEVNGKKIAGKIDKMIFHQDGSVSIRDLKVVRSASLNYDGGAKVSWTDQLNIYAAMLRRLGFVVRDLGVDLIIKDWSRGQTKYNPKYPRSPVDIVDVPMLSAEDADKYLVDRVNLHVQDPPPECTSVEYWGQGDRYAIYERLKGGALRKRASRVLGSIIDAEAYIKDNGISASIVRRPGRRIRCEENYCGVSSVCEQFKKAIEARESEEQDNEW